MRTDVIKADTIDAAVEGILNELKDTSRRENFIYFDGWEGLGASTVLQALAQRLASDEKTRPPGLLFEQVIHIDCSEWETTRAVQKEIAKQLKLPSRVIDMFDKQDEEEDFNGITDQGSRTEIPEVAAEIERSIQGRRFLLVLHTGSNEEIEIADLGLSVSGYLRSKVIWTFQGRFRMDSRMKDKVTKKSKTDVLLSALPSERDPKELWSYLLHEESTQVACKHGINPAIVFECFMYMLKLNCIRGHLVNAEYDLAAHICNYWVCDEVIQEITDTGEAWLVGEALQGEIQMYMDQHYIDFPSHLLMYIENIPQYWTSPAYGFVLVPTGVIPNGMFQHCDKLRVIKLKMCSFSFSSPPFLCCREEEDTTRSWACFQSLWVLELRYTDCEEILSSRVMDLMTQLRELNVMGANNWDMSHLQGRLPNIRKLRVTKSSCRFNNNMFSDKESLELLVLHGNIITQGMGSLYGPASNSSLKSVTIDGCVGLQVICLRGCKELNNMLICSEDFEELDLSGTSVKTLDLRAVPPRSLPMRIILLGCEKLCAILWPPEMSSDWWPEVLRISTTSPYTSAYGGEAAHAHPHTDQSLQEQKQERFKWRVSLTDTRLLRSLPPVLWYENNSFLHIDMCTAVTVGRSNIQGTSSDKVEHVQPHSSTIMDSKYTDTLEDGPVAVMTMWDCPKIFPGRRIQWTCFIKVIIHGQGNELLEDTLPDFTCQAATSLHVYDSPSIISIPGVQWNRLQWCQVERCPSLHTVFNVPRGSVGNSFDYLDTFWASQLLSASYIWDRPVKSYFKYLEFLHLDHCPRLVHVLPLSIWGRDRSFSRLETLEIVYCGDLMEVFPLDPQVQEEVLVFPKLRRIHLHELPVLQRICGHRMWAPKLETIRIRGCWSLRRLPAVGHNTKPPKVDCEKEWWDNLEWDGLRMYHHPSRYEPNHSLYYKKAQLPRGTVLR
ncbi:hypothetical protein VPH35_108009 [Triticum aestivum]